MHPDKEGRDAVNWTFAACLYRVFAGFAPFAVPVADPGKKADPHVIEDTLSGDIREGALIQANLAAPGLHEKIAGFIDAHIIRHEKNVPPPVIDADFTKNSDILPETALSQIKAQREAIAQKKQKRVKNKRFLIRNRALIGGIAGGLLAIGLVAGSFVHAQAEKWSTRGLSPAEVVAAYYDAFGVLDHETMSACLQKDAGKADVELVTNLFVVSKMREVYEQKRTVMNAADWDGTAPPPDTTVFGTLHLAADWPSGGANGETRDGPITAQVRYDLVLPSSYVGVEDAGISRIARDDTLRLEWQKNRWRITAIDRRERF
jgi:hypothetical protein